MKSNRIRTLIVDDELPARSLVRKFLSVDDEIDVVGECGDGCAAVEMIESTAPDLVFLDVQMPELDGFGVLQALDADKIPAIIFVTAFDQYALQAFEVHALDYLLKPFDRERFRRALDRAKKQLAPPRREPLHDELLRLLSEQAERLRRPGRILIKTAGRVFFVPTADITWIEAEGNYVVLHAGRQTYELRQTLNFTETQLDPGKFRRIQRSTIVNIDAIRELQPLAHGEYQIILKDGTELKLNHRYRQAFSQIAAGNL